MFIIDSNILIEAKRVHFPLAPKHPFWDWLVELGERGEIKIPEAVYKELEVGKDELSEWLENHKSLFFIPERDAYSELPPVLESYIALYDSEIDETELEVLKADPWVIAHAKALGGRVLSNERPKGKALKSIKEVKIPSVCKNFDIECVSLTQFFLEMKTE